MDYIRSMWTPPPASPNSSPEPPKTPVSRSESVKPTTARSNSSESTSSCKKKLTRAKLRENGIILDEKVSDIGLPDDVSKLKRHLLDIGQLRCHKEHAFDSKTGNGTETHCTRTEGSQDEQRTAQKYMDRTKAIMERVSYCADEEEDAWVDMVNKAVFHNWGKFASPEKLRTGKSMVEAVIKTGTRLEWTEDKKCRKLKDDSMRSNPRPDITFSISISKPSTKTMGRTDESQRNFTMEVLEACDGLQFSASRRRASKICFPITVTEVKPADVPKSERTFCYCQLANATSSALAMRCNLSQYHVDAGSWEGNRHGVPPMVGFTFVGSEVKLWLSWITDYQRVEEGFMNEYHSQCIWTGDLNKCLHAQILCRIVDQLAEWFLDEYRPWVSDRLDEWQKVGRSAQAKNCPPFAPLPSTASSSSPRPARHRASQRGKATDNSLWQNSSPIRSVAYNHLNNSGDGSDSSDSHTDPSDDEDEACYSGTEPTEYTPSDDEYSIASTAYNKGVSKATPKTPKTPSRAPSSRPGLSVFDQTRQTRGGSAPPELPPTIKGLEAPAKPEAKGRRKSAAGLDDPTVQTETPTKTTTKTKTKAGATPPKTRVSPRRKSPPSSTTE